MRCAGSARERATKETGAFWRLFLLLVNPTMSNPNFFYHRDYAFSRLSTFLRQTVAHGAVTEIEEDVHTAVVKIDDVSVIICCDICFPYAFNK